jgi:uncharacterized protein YkwD
MVNIGSSLWLPNSFCGIIIEMKVKLKVKSKNKISFQKKLSRNIFLVIIVFSVTAIGSLFVTDHFFGSNNLAAIVSSTLVSLTNKNRVSNNLAKLTTNLLLEQAAQLKADDMARRSYFAHLTPEGQDFSHFLKLVGYDYKYAGENLAFNFTESKDVAKAWMESPGHRQNILNNKYAEVGIASATGTLNGQEGIFVAQYFGTPIIQQ